MMTYICDSAVDFPEEDFDQVIQVNVKSVWTMCQAAARHMIPKGQGKIINTASVLSYQASQIMSNTWYPYDFCYLLQVGYRVPPYSASKSAVASLTKAMANEWAKHGINVNAIAPGYIATEMTTALRQDPERSKQILERIPAGRWGKPDDFKGPIVYLASRASDYVHGEITLVDGGWMGKYTYIWMILKSHHVLTGSIIRPIIQEHRIVVFSFQNDHGEYIHFYIHDLVPML